MYKYLYNNQIQTAAGFPEAKQQEGLFLPEGVDPINHFIVRIWHWDKNDDDFSIEILDAPGHQVFQDYDDAINCFKALIIDYPREAAEESKLELVQYHRGKITTYHSKILFPPLLAREP
jgi:hypothetical protein